MTLSFGGSERGAAGGTLAGSAVGMGALANFRRKRALLSRIEEDRKERCRIVGLGSVQDRNLRLARSLGETRC